MPYSAGNDPKLPAYVKKLKSSKRRRQWVHVFNGAYTACMRGSNDQKGCEAKAFRQANGVVIVQGGKRQPKNNDPSK